MKKEYDFLVFIGRFQPFHKGHQAVVELALKKAKHVIVLVGSSNSPRTVRNPFTFDERYAMITESMREAGKDENLHVLPLNDRKYNDSAWIAEVQDTVMHVMYQEVQPDSGLGFNVGLIGHSKDETSYYLKMFPQWGSVEVPNISELSATDVREVLLDFGHLPASMSEMYLKAPVKHLVQKYVSTPAFRNLQQEWAYLKEYKKEWVFKQSAGKAAKPLPTFHTTDAVVIQSGHILLVERRSMFGDGLWAMAGGFMHHDETAVDGMIRELREETCLRVPVPVLKGSITKKEVFDDPKRSDRGRIVTTAFLIELPDDPKGLPKVKGSDDARKAKWVPLSELRSDNMFEDHYHIICKMASL